MPRYELTEGKTPKFWTIEQSKNGKSYTIVSGKLGTAGQSKTKKLDSVYSCSDAVEKLIRAKLKDGYLAAIPIAPLATKPAKRKAGKAAKATAKSRKPAKAVEPSPEPAQLAARSNAALEAALCEAIDDDDRWLVYADWLQQAGDPRGEIIALSLARKKAAASKLATEHRDFLWGDATYLCEPDAFSKITWRSGWSKEAEPLAVEFAYQIGKRGVIESLSMSGLDEDGHVASALYRVVAAPIGRFVRSISLEATFDERFSGATGTPRFDAVIAAIARAKPAALRVLTMTTGGYQRSWTGTGDLSPLWKAAPHVEEIDIDLGSIELGDDLELPALRSLRLKTGGLARANVLAISKATWPSLETLVLYLGRPDYGGNVTRKDIAALLGKPLRFPKLKHLALCNSDIQGDVLAELAKSPLVAQLETLDISQGTLVDAETAPLVEHAAAFAKLKRLDVSENYLTEAMEKTLKKAFGKAIDVSSSRYGEMEYEREQYGNETWAKDATFRYAAIGE